MAKVLTMGSSVKCGLDPSGVNHGGNVALSSAAKLTINGRPVLLKSSIGPTVSGCKTPASNSTKACTSATVDTGEATKLKAGGSPVMLDTLAGKTDGNPAGTVPATAKQDKLTAI